MFSRRDAEQKEMFSKRDAQKKKILSKSLVEGNIQ